MLYKHSTNQLGNVAFYVVAVVPVALAICVFCIEVVAFQLKRTELQRVSDELAVGAARYLPDLVSAREFVNQQVANYPDYSVANRTEQATALLRITQSTVSLTLAGRFQPIFTSILPNPENYSLDYQQHAAARVVPIDSVIIVADSHNFRPASFSAWGHEGEWPASGYFSEVNNPQIAPYPGNHVKPPVFWPDWSSDFETTAYRRWATQSCYNPVWSAIKLAAISLVDVWGEIGENRLGVITTPGDNSHLGFSVLKDLGPINFDTAQAKWPNHLEEESLLSDELCWLMATEGVTLAADVRYQLPFRPRAFRPSSSYSRCREPGYGDVANQPHFPFNKIDRDCLTETLQLREAIYYHMARANGHWAGSENVLNAVIAARAMLLNRAVLEDSEIAQERRALATLALRRIVLLSDAIPSIQAFEPVIEGLGQNPKIELVVVPILHQGLSRTNVEQLNSNANSLRRHFEARPQLTVFATMTPQEVSETGTQLLLGLSRQVVLAR